MLRFLALSSCKKLFCLIKSLSLNICTLFHSLKVSSPVSLGVPCSSFESSLNERKCFTKHDVVHVSRSYSNLHSSPSPSTPNMQKLFQKINNKVDGFKPPSGGSDNPIAGIKLPDLSEHDVMRFRKQRGVNLGMPPSKH